MLAFMVADGSVADPSDAFIAKWGAYGITAIWFGIAIYKGSETVMEFSKEHTKNKRKSTKGKHEKGNSRKSKDQGGEKGDESRRWPRNPPGGWRNWKGTWPPVSK